MMNWLPWLDGLRGLSIILVITSHLCKNIDVKEPFDWLLEPLGRVGVSIFFVISGFIITSSLLQERKNKGKIKLKKFYQRRIFRIVPAAFLYLVSYAIWKIHQKEPISKDEILAVIFLAVGLWKVTTWFTGHFWSLCVEEQFYLVMPIFLKKYGIEFLQKACWLILILAPFLRAALYSMTGNRYDMSIFWVVDSLAAGILIAKYYNQKKTLPLVGAVPTFFLATILAVISFCSFQGIYGKITVPFGGTILAAFGACLICFGNRGTENKGFNLLCHRYLILIGQWSYSMYLFQQIFLPPSKIVSEWWQKPPFNLIGVILFSSLSYYFWESPWRKAGRKIAGKP